MARSMTFVCLAVAFLAAFTNGAAATLGKGAALVTKPHLSFAKACVDVCKDRCKHVPTQVCADIAIPYKECSKVPVTSTVQKCKKICTTTTTTVTEVVAPTGPIEVPFGKKGRHLMGKGKGVAVIAPSVACKDECADVPITTYTVQCEAKVRTAQQCRTIKQKVCTPVCRPKCSKVPVYSEEQVVVPVPVMGKGKGVDMLVGKGKGL